MRTHIKVIAWLNIAFGIVMTLLCAGAGAACIFIGKMVQQDLLSAPAASTNEWGSNPTSDPFPFALQHSAIATGYVMIGIAFVVGVPAIIAGVGLLRLAPWSRNWGIVVSILNILCLNPIHLAMGVYGLVVLCSQETIALFLTLPVGNLTETPLPGGF